jgi:tRNA 2-thiouridine synthesizing protein A
MRATEELDIRGETCPHTFLYTKIKVEELAYQGGGILKVTLDYPPAAKNIPRSLAGDRIGARVVDVKEEDGAFELVIEVPDLGEGD